jgi:hypothetical protein
MRSRGVSIKSILIVVIILTIAVAIAARGCRGVRVKRRVVQFPVNSTVGNILPASFGYS